jgi:multiple sugar transport system ATP-binding protein
MADVVLRGVAKRFGETRVIEGLDLEVRDRELMVLVGPSGCGKSTALRMVAGLEDATEGTISIGDRVVNDVPPKDRDIAMVFQSYALYPHMTVRENLEFGLRIRKTPAAEVARLVADAAQVLGIVPLLDRKPKELSGGQRSPTSTRSCASRCAPRSRSSRRAFK